MRFRSLSEALQRFEDNNPPKIVVPQSSQLGLVFGSLQPVVTPAVSGVMRWGDDSVWGVTPITNYIYPNQLTDPDGEWK